MGLKAAPWRPQVGRRENDDCFTTSLFDHVCHLFRKYFSRHYVFIVEREEVRKGREVSERKEVGEGDVDEREVGEGREVRKVRGGRR